MTVTEFYMYNSGGLVYKDVNGDVLATGTRQDRAIPDPENNYGVFIHCANSDTQLYCRADGVQNLTFRLQDGTTSTVALLRDALLELLAENFFFVDSNGGFIETEINISAVQISTIGTAPINILPAPGLNKYYQYEGVLEYNFNTVALSFLNDFLGITSDYSGGAGSYAGVWFNNDYSRNGSFDFSSQSPYLPKAVLEPLVQGPAKLNTPLTLLTWNGTDPVANDGTIKIKLKYKVKTFG